MGVVSILIKNLTRTEPATRIVFYMALFMTLFSLPVAVPFFAPLSPVEYAKAFAVALSSTIAHLLLARAYTKAEMVVLMPFDYSRLIFTAVLAYFVFAEQLDSWTVIGSLVIVASSVYITHREALLKKLP